MISHFTRKDPNRQIWGLRGRRRRRRRRRRRGSVESKSVSDGMCGWIA
jgi:hypothetical protein